MIVLVVGGASSGKSKMAEDICLRLKKPLYYLATMEDNCSESRRKISGHREMRKGKGFETIEMPKEIERAVFDKRGTVLLECVGNLLSNEMFSQEFDPNPCHRILEGIDSVISKNENAVIVSNDIFNNLEGLDEGSLAYVRNLAHLNIEIAKRADVVIEAVCSLLNIIKGEEICRSSGIF